MQTTAMKTTGNNKKKKMDIRKNKRVFAVQ